MRALLSARSGSGLTLRTLFLLLLREKTKLIDASGTEVVDNVNNTFVTGARVGAYVHRFVQLVGEHILHLGRQLIRSHGGGPQEALAITGYRDEHGIFLVSGLHLHRIFGFYHVD